MVFENAFWLHGLKYTYRDYWAMCLGTFAGAAIISGSVVSLICSKYAKSREKLKSPDGVQGDTKFVVISVLVCLLYAASILMLGMLSGLMVYGGQSLALYILALIAVQVIFVLMGIYVHAPYLADSIAVTSIIFVGGSILFLVQLPSMFDYSQKNLTWLIAVFGSLPMSAIGAWLYLHYAKFSDTSSSGEDTNSIELSSDQTPNPSILNHLTLSIVQRLKLSYQKWQFWVSVLVFTGVGVFLTFLLAGSCVAVYVGPHNGSTWFSFGGTVFWNSRMLRATTSKFCDKNNGINTPCHVYLTAGPDLTSSLFVNVHLPSGSSKSLTVVVSSTGQRFTSTPQPSMPLLDDHDQRDVFSIFLHDLPAGSELGFKLIGDESAASDGTLSSATEYFLKTASASGPVSFVVGGDSGSTSYANAIVSQMSITKPHLIIIGGDIAYDNGFISCACAWDAFLKMFEKNKIEGKFLPILSFAAGNHDVGVNDEYKSSPTAPIQAYSRQLGGQCNVESTIHAPPLLFVWFPFEVDTNGNALPICERSTLHLHSISSLMNLWMLDSAYTKSVQENIDFVNNNIGNSKLTTTPVNFAVYHVPLYSSLIEEYKVTQYLRDSWPSEIFDKHRFNACFENHSHSYKRTVPLIANEPIVVNDSSSSAGTPDTLVGTVYLGDGRMGTDSMNDPSSDDVTSPKQNSIFAKSGSYYHFFHVTVDPSLNTVAINSIDQNGNIFDSVTIPMMSNPGHMAITADLSSNSADNQLLQPDLPT